MSKTDINKEISARNMKRLKDEHQVRDRPGVIFGTNDEKGAFNGVNEVIDNSIDEAREGFGDTIDIIVEENNIITVIDRGRGLPMDYNEEEGMYNWELALCTLYASGKYDGAQYGQALGLNGLGLTSIQYASSFMQVWSTYGGKTRYMEFVKGKPSIPAMKTLKPIVEGTGTKIRFQPDSEIFPALRNVALTADMFLTSLRKKAMLMPGLTINLTHYELKNPVKFKYDNGPVDYIDSLVEKYMMNKTVEFYDSEVGTDSSELNGGPADEPYRVDMKIAFNFSREAGLVEIYHNSSHMFEGGKTVSAFETALTAAFNDYAKSANKLSKSDKLIYKDIADIMLCVASTNAPGYRTWFKNQTKGAITNPFIGKAFANFVYSKVRYWLDNNTQIANKVLTEAINNKIAREEGAEVRKKVINNLSKAVKFGSTPKGFKDCSSKNVLERELYIVEGLSALTSVKLACNPKFQAVIAVRGKTINCLKEKLSKVLNSEVVINIYRILGCGMEAKSEYITDLPKFDINKLNWGKIIICTDADVDGYHIRTLLLTMFYVLSPSLIKSGRVYIAETPLYEIEYKKELKFAYDESEKEYIIESFKNMGATMDKIKIQRDKGLGENDAEMMALTTMNVGTRRLIPVEYPEDDSMLRDYFNALLGDDLETRRILINEYFDTVEAV